MPGPTLTATLYFYLRAVPQRGLWVRETGRNKGGRNGRKEGEKRRERERVKLRKREKARKLKMGLMIIIEKKKERKDERLMDKSPQLPP